MSNVVYSTDKGRLCPQCSNSSNQCTCKANATVYENNGYIQLSHETKGRKGKGVTLISGIPGTEKDIKAFAKKLKQKCNCGGSVKNGIIEIQGDHRTVLKEYLEKTNYKIKVSGT